MSSKTKKLISSIAAVIIFVIAGIFYLTAPSEDTTETGDGTSYESDSDYGNQSIDSGNEETADVVNTTVESVAESTAAPVVGSDSVGDEAVAEDFDVDEEAETNEVTYEFRKQQNLDDHFEKHGSEFDYETAEEYLAGANRVINDPNSLYKTEAEDGDHIYYLESTNEFVVVSTDGYIRTYFRPSAGIDYFNRQ
ncbi:MAG: hypothetical protein IJZ96_11405 [Lachnospiraceae bacterium]|nr:hypothetical protein [Lachnospiraceae bacterium]